MQLTKKQEEGLRTTLERYKNHEPWTCIAGYAGVGKSTLVNFIIQALELDPAEEVAYIAYTGKAALVLKQKGCPNAMTAHKLLYKSYRQKNGIFVHKPKRFLDKDYKIIVVDEVSMLPAEMWELLLSHRIHVLALGDPFQLPPIGQDNGILQKPHIFLDEIMRQAKESEIIRLTMDIREGKPLQLYQGEEVRIYSQKDMCNGMLEWADQILCGKNVTRRSINKLRRQQLFGVEDNTPITGDKIICLQNNYDILSQNDEVLINGLIGTIEQPYIWDNAILRKDTIVANFSIENDIFLDVEMDLNMFLNGVSSIDKKDYRKLPKDFQLMEFDYGYAVTYWKAQGSEWDKVLVLEEDWPKVSTESHRKALYTAATRAKKKLVIIRNY